MRAYPIAAALLMSVIAMPALAQPESPGGGQAWRNPGTTGLTRCMIEKASEADRAVVDRWVIAGLASAPSVASVIKVDPAAKDAADHDFAALFTRLITVDCADAAKTARKAGDDDGVRIAVMALSRVAVRDLTTDPTAHTALDKFEQYLDKDRFK